jgi:hypothetical protein
MSALSDAIDSARLFPNPDFVYWTPALRRNFRIVAADFDRHLLTLDDGSRMDADIWQSSMFKMDMVVVSVPLKLVDQEQRELNVAWMNDLARALGLEGQQLSKHELLEAACAFRKSATHAEPVTP